MNVVDTARHYLVVTRRAAESFARMTGAQGVGEPALRSVLLSCLRDARPVAEWQKPYGRLLRVRFSLEWGGKVFLCGGALSYGERGGQPILAHDGKKQMVFLVGLDAGCV